MAEKIKSVSYKVVNQAGEEVSKVSLPGEYFGVEPNKQVMFDAINVYQANMRQATAKTLRRDEVRGGGKKPWKQKGTGRARAGSSRSPIWVGGGNVFGPTGTQNYKLSMNKKAHALAVASALSEKAKSNDLVVVDSLEVSNAKTKEVAALLNKVGATGKVLAILTEENVNFIIGSNNISNLLVCGLGDLCGDDIVNADKVLFTADLVNALKGGNN